MSASTVVKLFPLPTPARQALADQLLVIERAHDELLKASRPRDRLREQLGLARKQVTEAEAELAAIDVKHAEAMRDQAKEDAEIVSVRPPASAKAEAALDNALRTCNAVQAALDGCERDLKPFNEAFQAAHVSIDALMLDVLTEEHSSSCKTLQAELARYEKAEADIFGLVDAMSVRGRQLLPTSEERARAWLQAADRFRAITAKLPRLESSRAITERAAARWNDFVSRLIGDAAAKVSE
jgi:chromosome segregation ATPase